MHPAQTTSRNCFLRALAPDDFVLVLEHLETVDLPRRMVLVEADRPIRHVYFPFSGMASIVALQPDREMIEVGAFGFEGSSDFVIDAEADRVPLRIFMQIGGEGVRMAAHAFSEVARASRSFMIAVMRYEQYKATQFAYTALSHGAYTVPERLARWLLMAQDRVGDDLPITHDYLSMMLAVRRAGVSEGIHLLEGMGFIKAGRGQVTVKDRAGMCHYANGSYGVPEREYQRLVGPGFL